MWRRRRSAVGWESGTTIVVKLPANDVGLGRTFHSISNQRANGMAGPEGGRGRRKRGRSGEESVPTGKQGGGRRAEGGVVRSEQVENRGLGIPIM